MTKIRNQQKYELYRRITAATVEDVAEADWIADLITELNAQNAIETAKQVYDQDEIFLQGFFVNSGHTIVVEPHWYDADDNLLTVGDKVTLTPTASSSDNRDLGDGGGAANYFPSPFQYLANPGANYLRLKATTLPAGLVGLFLGGRA